MHSRWSIPFLVVALLPGCRNDEPSPSGVEAEKAEATAEADASAAEDGVQSKPGSPKADSAASSHRVAVPLGSRKPLLGHFAMAPLADMVDEVREQLVPAAFAPMVTTGALRSALFGKADDAKGRAIIEHLDMTRPLVCGIADPLVLDEPVGCALGYEGGVAQLVKDYYSDAGSTEAAAGHAAHVRDDDGDHVYLDERDGLVVVSRDPEFFAKAGDPLLQLAAAPPSRDLELVLYPAVMHELYMPLLRDELDQLATGKRTGSELRKRLEDKAWGQIKKGLSRAGVDEEKSTFVQDSLAKLDALTADDAKKALEELDAFEPYIAQVDAVGLGLGLEPAGLVFSAWYGTVPGSSIQAQLLAGPKLERSWLARLPESSILLGASVDVDHEVPTALAESGSATSDDEWTELAIEVLTELYEEQTGNPGSVIEPEIRDLLAGGDELYGPRSGWAVFTDPAGPGALVVMLDNQPGKSGRDDWKRWSEVFSAERILGAELVEYVTWEHEVAALEVGGVPVDRLTFRVEPKVGKELHDEPTLAKLAAYIDEHAGVELYVDRLESDGRTTFVFAPEGSEAYVRAAVSAQGNTDPPAGVDAILARGPHPLSLWAFDVKKTLDIVREALGDDAPDALKTALVGTDLADLYGVTYLRPDGGAADFVVSQPLIDQLRALATR